MTIATSTDAPPLQLDPRVIERALELLAMTTFELRCEQRIVASMSDYIDDDELRNEALSWALLARLKRAPDIARRHAVLRGCFVR